MESDIQYEFADSPILGFGDGFFSCQLYALSSKLFKDISDSTYSFLADNIVSPFNEYLFLRSNSE